ncbi:MAG: hypothetical protein FWC89_03660 [Defluviitaleaceae bacterium]|nr:hypothetical protein [Defluviitaleaceae bacterium]
MFTEGIREIFLEGADKHGWLNNRDSNIEIEKAKEIAKKILLRGLSIEDVAEDTGLSTDIVTSIANQLEKTPAVI